MNAFYCAFTVNYSSTSSHPLLLLPWKLAFKNDYRFLAELVQFSKELLSVMVFISKLYQHVASNVFSECLFNKLSLQNCQDFT